ncbi:coenzyme F420-0:L-glutamate ligase [Bacilliculturomica massiliensis]|uniref:coenzyme F420-0:L-glutamate ligase n=1 Tax=Bacilliculturomica massiliensis TaxID=1917867 RepID=UPI001030A1FB|nr:coenzyme F420-0:L-glutamate ligase [Bacilliculturomica massiliensis]
MERMVGTVVRGLRAPIIREGDDLESIVVDAVLKASKEENFALRDKDVVAVTEAVVARAQGNYATTDQLAEDVRAKLGGETIGVIFPILSRNRFAICLRGIARGAKKIVLMLSYPSDEVGNHLIEVDRLDEKGIDPYKDVLTQAQFEELFGKSRHTFTGMDYVNYYKELIEEEGAEAEIIFANDPRVILDYTKRVLTCDIHTRVRSKRLLKAAGGEIVLGMDDLLTSSVNGGGYNEKYGILGSNKSTEDTIKLFPNNCAEFVNAVQKKLHVATGKTIEVMVYGDGAFKDPVGKIWELADPVVSPGYTSGLEGTPNEVKLKYLADNDFADLSGDELKEAISDYIRKKDDNLGSSMAAQGTTPRRLTDLIGSLCDLTSGSGDKGTPIVYIQGYFDNYTK